MKSIMQEDCSRCYLCGRPPRQEHHVFGGANRRKSEKNGLKVKLCLECHIYGPEAVHTNQETMRRLRQEGQRAFERTHTRAEFISEFGKNYLQEDT